MYESLNNPSCGRPPDWLPWSTGRFKKVPTKPTPAHEFARAVLVGVAVMLVIGWRQSGKAQAPSREGAPRPLPTVAVHPRQFEWTTTLPCSFHAAEYANLYAKVSGYVARQTVDIGDRVTQGQTLVEIDAPEAVQEVRRCRAALAQAEAQAKLAKARIEGAAAEQKAAEAAVQQSTADLQKLSSARVYRDKSYARIEALARRQAVQQELVDEEEEKRSSAIAAETAGQATITSARAQLASAQAKVAQAQAEAEAARANVQVVMEQLGEAETLAAYTKIAAPCDGVITRRTYHQGDFIRSAASGASEPILSIARTDTMRVVVQVPEADMPILDRGDPASIEITALGVRLEAAVARSAEVEDPNTHAMRAEIDVPNLGDRLRAGMSGTATITLVPAHEAIVIPASAVFVADGVANCFRVVDGRAVRTRIKVGAAARRSAEIVEGLKDGDVVINDAQGVRDGEPIAPRPVGDTTERPRGAPSD
jgi:RND family efflux transporter MFP subunit